METLGKVWGWLRWVLVGVVIVAAAIVLIPAAPARRRKLNKEIDKLNKEQEAIAEEHDRKIAAVESSEKVAINKIKAELNEELNDIEKEKVRIKKEADKGPVALAKEWADFLGSS